VDQVGEFFRTLPDVAVAFWKFANDAGVNAVLVTLGTFVLLAALLIAARATREVHGWISAILGAMGATVAMYWAFGVIPSAWVYFVDGSRDILAGAVIPEALPLMNNFYQVFRDTVVIILTAIAVMGLSATASYIQKKYPRTLAEGEEARPQSGGYK
jgi:hypothetical protein